MLATGQRRLERFCHQEGGSPWILFGIQGEAVTRCVLVSMRNRLDVTLVIEASIGNPAGSNFVAADVTSLLECLEEKSCIMKARVWWA